MSVALGSVTDLGEECEYLGMAEFRGDVKETSISSSNLSQQPVTETFSDAAIFGGTSDRCLCWSFDIGMKYI